MATADPSTPASSGLSPKEEGELEDGEISDDDNNSRSSGSSGSGGGGSGGGGGLLAYPRRRPPPPARGGGSGGGGGGSSSSSSSSSQQQLRNFSRSRHPAERGQLRGPSSYRPKEPFRTHPPPGRMPSGSLSESSPRPSFWERSHIALDRFRFRGSRPYRGGSRWSRGRGLGERGGKPGCRPPGGGSGGSGGGGGGAGSGFGSSQSWREPSPPRKSCILNVAVRPGCVARAPFGVMARSRSFLTFQNHSFLSARRRLSRAALHRYFRRLFDWMGPFCFWI